MDIKFKRHEKVKITINPSESDIESYDEENVKLTKGTIGEVNMVLPNGRYHIVIKNAEGDKIAYVVVDEEALESIPNQKLSHEDKEEINENLKESHKTKSKRIKK